MEKTKKVYLKAASVDEGLRLDQYIIKKLDIPISRSRIQRLINGKEITVNQKSPKAHYKVKVGDAVIVNVPPVERPKPLPEKISLEIIFEDEDILVVNKPSGMVTHPAVGSYSHTLINALLNYGCPLSSISGPLRPGIVHRLDKDTSGLIVVAKNDFAHQSLSRQFQKHSVKRKYIAIVRGKVAHNEGMIDLPIGRHPQNRQKMAVSFLKKSRTALTRYKVLKRHSSASLLELTPHTGRTHQLRVHLKFLGHPILGDGRYGSATSFARLALHAKVLGFEHPRSKRNIEFESDIPECFTRFIATLKQ